MGALRGGFVLAVAAAAGLALPPGAMGFAPQGRQTVPAVMALATADGTLAARYDYDPYGRLIHETGPKSATCSFRYSTKWYDADLGLLYYGHRWYDAAAMKWLTPDPIGKRGGGNGKNSERNREDRRAVGGGGGGGKDMGCRFRFSWERWIG